MHLLQLSCTHGRYACQHHRHSHPAIPKQDFSTLVFVAHIKMFKCCLSSSCLLDSCALVQHQELRQKLNQNPFVQVTLVKILGSAMWRNYIPNPASFQAGAIPFQEYTYLKFLSSQNLLVQKKVEFFYKLSRPLKASSRSSSYDIAHEFLALFAFSVVNSFPSHASPWRVSKIFLSIPSRGKEQLKSCLVLKLIRSKTCTAAL